MLHQTINAVDAADAAGGEYVGSADLARLFTSDQGGFTALEMQVIALARGDTLGSLEAPGRIERLMAWMFGLAQPVRALADRRLEALRRATVVARHRRHVPDAIAAELRDEGFSQEQVRRLETLASGDHAKL